MTAWLLLACAVCAALKLAGWLVPASVLADERVADVVALVTVGLLAALVAVQTVGGAGGVVLDARLAALVAAAVALALRAPFVVVVLVGAAVAAGCRALGWG